MQLSIFDFDGTLFASPERPDWWTHQGFWGRPESLNPPYVPERPDADWWSYKVVAEARRAISDPDTYAVLLTGRPGKLEHRIKALLNGVGLHFAEYHFAGSGGTLAGKFRVLDDLVAKIPDLGIVEMWEDRPEHIGSFESYLKQLGVEFEVHKVPRVTHAFENPPTAALKVAHRFMARQGTCPCCFHSVRIHGKPPSIEPHWFKRPGWSATQVHCYGVGYQPLELSVDGTEKLVSILQGRISWYEHLHTNLKSGKIQELWIQGSTQKLTKVTTESPVWVAALADRIDKTELRIASLVKDIQLLGKIIATWEPKELGSTSKIPKRFVTPTA